ncbi:MAG: SGNH/GDSL hydrolase family protein [Armatimonadota bacterium]
MKRYGIFLLFFSLLASGAMAAERRAELVTGGRADADGKAVWYDCRVIGIEGKGWQEQGQGTDYSRFPAKAQGKVPNAVWELGKNSAGLCVRFRTDAPVLQVRWELISGTLAMPHMPASGVSGVDLYAKPAGGKWHFVGNGRPSAIANTAAFSGFEQDAELLLYFPLYNGVTKVEIGIPAGKTISRVLFDKNVKPLVFYGTSITQGGCASRPGLAATAIAGRALDLPVINLGFSGSGRMEPVMADLIGEVEASVYVLDCLWNMSNGEVHERVVPFVKKLRELHPDTPILLVEDSTFQDTVPTWRGKQLRAEYEVLQRDGVKGLYFLSAKGMLGADREGTVDGCHPNDLGMMRQAEAFVGALTPLLVPVK